MITIDSTSDETTAIRAVNALFVSGLILDIMSAMLAYLTGRWLERLTEQEKDILEEYFASRDTLGSSQPTPQRSPLEFIYYSWMAFSLFVPMPLLTLGVVCMMAGIYTYVWTQHSFVLAGLVTLAGVVALPFVIGDLFIGIRKNSKRREKVIRRLSEMQGDW